MLSLFLTLLACSSEPEVTPSSTPEVTPQADTIRTSGEILTSTYVVFAPGDQHHLVPLACFDTTSRNSGRGSTCLDHVGVDAELQLEDGRMVSVGSPTDFACRSSGRTSAALRTAEEHPIGSGIQFAIWPNLRAAQWVGRTEDRVHPAHNRPLIEAARTSPMGQALNDELRNHIRLRTVLELDLEGDGTEDSLVEAYVTNTAGDQDVRSTLFVGGTDPLRVTAPNLSESTRTRVLGATRTTSEGAWLILLETISDTETGWSMVQRTDRGFIARGSWNCDPAD